MIDYYGRIEAACKELGHPFGFNPLLLCSQESFKSDLMFATLNPAGNRDYPDHRGRGLYENGNAYLNSQTPLNNQIQQAFAHLQRRVGYTGTPLEFARTQIVTTQLVPFRSPNWKSLHRSEESLAFVKDLWADIFSSWKPRAVVAVGGVTLDLVTELLGPELSRSSMPSGWGDVQIHLRECKGTRLLGLPHLSRFQIFGRYQSEPYLAKAFDWVIGE